MFHKTLFIVKKKLPCSISLTSAFSKERKVLLCVLMGSLIFGSIHNSSRAQNFEYFFQKRFQICFQINQAKLSQNTVKSR